MNGRSRPSLLSLRTSVNRSNIVVDSAINRCSGRRGWRFPGQDLKFGACLRSFTRHSQEAGQSFVEIALVLPVLLLVLAGIFDIGRSVQAYVVILNAGREVAMTGAANQTETMTLNQLAMEEITRGGLNSDLASVTIEYQGRGFPVENHIIVQVDYQMPLLLAVLSLDNIRVGTYTEMIVFW